MKSWQGLWQPHHRGVESQYNSVLHTFLIDDEAWRIFKRYPVYNGIVGNDAQPREVGQRWYDLIKQDCPYLLDKLPDFARNDTHGDPFVFDYEGLTISPGTLAYTYILGDMEKEFGLFTPNTTIVEIGGGYGGQMLVTLIHRAISYYNLIDLPLAILVAQKYMQYFPQERENTAIGFYDVNALPDVPHDLVVSNFCLTELDDTGIDSYLEHIFTKTRNCYILSNFYATDHLRGREAGRQERLVEKLEKIYQEVTVTEFCKGTNEMFTTHKIVGKGAKNVGE